jgi:hypothetical protein
VPLTQSAEDGYLTIGLRGNPFDVRFGSLADMRIAKRHVRFTPSKAVEIADIAGPDRGQSISALPFTSNVYLLRDGEGIVHINAEIPDSALYLRVTKQNLDGAQILGAPINQRRLRSPQNVCRTNGSSKEITRQLTDRTDIFIGSQWSMGRHKLRDTHGSPNVEENMWDRGPLSGPYKQAFLTARTRILKLDRLPIEL